MSEILYETSPCCSSLSKNLNFQDMIDFQNTDLNHQNVRVGGTLKSQNMTMLGSKVSRYIIKHDVASGLIWTVTNEWTDEQTGLNSRVYKFINKPTRYQRGQKNV